MDFDKFVAQVSKGSEQRKNSMNAGIISRSCAQKLARSMVTESVNSVGAASQQLGEDALSRLRRGLERTYVTVCAPCHVVLTSVSGAAATSIRWNGEEGGDDGEW